MISEPWTPVGPGWIVVPAEPEPEHERHAWAHVVGWTQQGQPVIATGTGGVQVWRILRGEDPFHVTTLKEWREGH